MKRIVFLCLLSLMTSSFAQELQNDDKYTIFVQEFSPLVCSQYIYLIGDLCPEYIFNKAYNIIIKREINSLMKRETNYKRAQDLDRHFFNNNAILIA